MADSDDKKKATQKSASEEVEIIMPPNPISKKVTRGGFGAVDAQTLERAEKVIEELGDDYLSWVEKDLNRLIAASEKLRTSEDRRAVLDEIFQIAHDIKGQGGSFGFDLMTRLGNHLCRLIESMDDVGPKEETVIQLHIDAMKNVVHQQIKGNGGDEFAEVIAGLEALIQKYSTDSDG